MKKYLLPLFGAALFYAACDDELVPVSGNTAETVTAFNDLSECNKNIVGKLVYVSDSVKMYACTDEGWAAITGAVVSGKNGSNGADGKDGVNGKDGANGKDGVNGKDGANGKDGVNGKDGTNGKDGIDGKDGKSCTMTAFKDGTGFDVICDGKSIGIVKNGSDGAKGKDGTNGINGTNGKDGTSCSVAKAENSDDVVVTCGEKSVTIHNGVDGKPGAPGTNGTNGKDGTSCSVAKAENSDDVVVTCGEKSVTIHNGVDGQPGAPGTNGTNGTNGNDGASCEGVLNADGSITIKCDGKEVGTIKNGTNGTNGHDGASCKIASDKDGVVQLQCGEGENATTTKLYKAICGTQPYDPENSVCKEGNLFYSCGKEIYDPEIEFCYENKRYTFCEGGAYDPSKKFCRADKLYDLCDGKAYNLASEFCYENKKYIFCEGDSYNPSEKFCAYNKLYALCGGKDYDPVTYQCENGQVVVRPNLCGDVGYDPDEEFCAEFNGGAVKQVYKMVTITTKSPVYSKTWMAENLKYETKNSSCYNNVQSNCDTYGRLYTWAAAVGKTEDVCGSGKLCVSNDAIQGICPDGWHLPSSDEWVELINAVGGVSEAVSVLKSREGWEKSNGTDNYGFSVLPGGEFVVASEAPSLGYYYILENAAFWTSEADGKSNAYGVLFDNIKVSVNGGYSKDDRFSVRCIMDE